MTRSSGGRTTLYVKSVSGPDPRPSVLKKHGFKNTNTYKIAGPMGDVFYMKNTSSIPTITKADPHIDWGTQPTTLENTKVIRNMCNLTKYKYHRQNKTTDRGLTIYRTFGIHADYNY